MDKEIKDPEAVLKVITALFGKLPVQIFHRNTELPCRIVALKNKALLIYNTLAFETKERQLTVIHNGMKMRVLFHCAASDGNGIEILSPIKLTMSEAKREGARVEIKSNSNSSYTISNLINASEVQKAIGFTDKKVDEILENHKTKLTKQFKMSSIFYSERQDNRLRLIHKYDKPIYILNRKDKNTANPKFFPFEEYQRIFDSSKISSDIVSEICVPIKYKGYIDIGYVQILGETALDIEAYNQALITANTLSRDLIATGVFLESKEVSPVLDISLGGLSFVHPNTRMFARTMTLNVNIIFDVTFSPSSRVSFRGIIKNMRNQENDFRVGCQFYNLNPKETEFLKNLLDPGSNTQEKSAQENQLSSEPEHSSEEDNSEKVNSHVEEATYPPSETENLEAP